jgi:hypothetical protein
MVGKINTLPNAVLVLKSGFLKNGGKCQTEYSEDTAVAGVCFRVLVGYYRGNGYGHV